ncbi:PAS domain-containing hybrid sensor histidine kinase/response regulator [Symbioplanes lichenis]|uniref:PAS domain-containing hybrid sensor histidine kinase/response regulator n=1 Tax=Symbioplanes lichenis TaxID=1629072 RepID=UPI002738CA5F|nr:ATP-binding protein [Actinoplanes lichenis]
MAQQWALAGNIVIGCAYAAITMAILGPVVRAGQLRTNRLAVATSMIFFSCAVGHALHAAMYWRAAYETAAMPGMRHAGDGWPLWPSAAWDVLTAAVGVYYWSLRRGYKVLLGGSGALFEDTAERRRRLDIDLREQAEAERDAQAAMVRAVITNSQSAIYVKDLDGRYLLANETIQRAFGRTEDEILGRTDADLYPAMAPVWQANDRRAQAGPIHVDERLDVGGEVRLYESNKFPLYDADGTLYAVCGVSLDVTDLRRATETAEAARDEALAQSRVKSEFLATMSHEIRTPMNGVLGLASLLMGTELDASQRRYAAGIHSAGNALLGVINDILDFSKVEAGKIVLDPADFDPGALLAEVAALVAPAAEGKDLTVVTRRGPRLPASVRGDGGRVRQVLLNLAGNAVKFTGRGSVTLRADLLEQAGGGPVVRFEVTDTGIGIAPGDAGRLFEPFTQADASTTRTYGGTGLGLAISRQLTEVMGGSIGVDSEPGQGSTFWCVIPFEAAAGDVAQPAPDPAGLRVLLACAAGERLRLEADLRRWGFTATGVDTGPAAMLALRDAALLGRPYDLLLLDADPGDVDTEGLARAVAADEAIPAVHVVVLNEAPPPGALSQVTYLPTPVHRSALFDLLAQCSAAPARTPGGAPAAAAPGSRGTVLLVEDNDINQMVAVGVLTSLGYAADVAGDGLRACEMAAAGRYDAILMDCRMPRMDGFTATARLREREAAGAPRTPIIAMTASALMADRERCLAAGMDDYLSKPVNPGELERALLKWIPGAPARIREPAPADAGDPVRARLDELAGDRTPPELALVDRLVTSFLSRAPRHLAALRAAAAEGRAGAVEEQAHTFKGAAGNIGAEAVARLCARVEDDARAGRLPEAVLLDGLEVAIEQVEQRLRAVLAR